MDSILTLAPYDSLETLVFPTEIPSGIALINPSPFWAKGYKGQNIKIAVLDTGCQVNHFELQGRIIGGHNFTFEDNGNPDKYDDYNGHGTHVAGIIAASEDNGGVVGVAPLASLLILKVLDRNGSGNYTSLIRAIQYAIDQRVDVISMSLGGPTDLPELRDVIRKAINQDIVVVCAAANSGDGNASTREYAYPAYYPQVIAVGASTNRLSVAPFSNSNEQIDLIAPGTNILSTFLGSRYAIFSGTSMAAPHVAGALALLINRGMAEFGRRLTETELYGQLLKHTVSMGLPKSLEGNGHLYLPISDQVISLYRQKLI